MINVITFAIEISDEEKSGFTKVQESRFFQNSKCQKLLVNPDFGFENPNFYLNPNFVI